jgi:hypothetical protein
MIKNKEKIAATQLNEIKKNESEKKKKEAIA